MRYAEVNQLEREQIAYHCLLFRLALYKESLEKITLFRTKNRKGRLMSTIACYVTDCNNNHRCEKYRLYDEEYLFFLCSAEHDFPDVPFVDLTDDKYKLVKIDEQAAGADTKADTDKAVNDAEV